MVNFFIHKDYFLVIKFFFFLDINKYFLYKYYYKQIQNHLCFQFLQNLKINLNLIYNIPYQIIIKVYNPVY